MSQNQNVPDVSAEVEELSGKELREDKLGDERGSQANSEVPERQETEMRGCKCPEWKENFYKGQRNIRNGIGFLNNISVSEANKRPIFNILRGMVSNLELSTGLNHVRNANDVYRQATSQNFISHPREEI